MTDKEKLKLIKAIAAGAYDLITDDNTVNASVFQATLNAIEIVAEFGEGKEE